MADQNNTAENTTQTGERKAWPQRFGTMTGLQIKSGRNGAFGIVTIDCVKFTQTAMVFNATALEKLKAAGQGAKVWVKGPIEAVERKNADGGTYMEDVFKVVYAKDITADASQGNDDAAAAAPVEPQDLTAIKGVGAKVAEALNAAGVTTYAGLVAMSDEDLEAAGKGFASRAVNGDWRAQAEALDETKGASSKPAKEVEAEIPF